MEIRNLLHRAVKLEEDNIARILGYPDLESNRPHAEGFAEGLLDVQFFIVKCGHDPRAVLDSIDARIELYQNFRDRSVKIQGILSGLRRGRAVVQDAAHRAA